MKRFISVLAFLLVAGGLQGICGIPAESDRNPVTLKNYHENPTNIGVTACPYEFVPTHDTRAPRGYKPFYISHYGRHGSRSAWEEKDYSNVVFALQQAAAAGILTASGDSLLNEATRVLVAHDGQEGRLTPLGAEENSKLAERMYRRYRRVFRRNKHIDVLSSVVPRCLVSMAAFTNRLHELDHKLVTEMNSNEAIVPFVNNSEPAISKPESKRLRDSIRASWTFDPAPLMCRVFSDTAKAREFVPEPVEFVREVFYTARISWSFGLTNNMFRFLSEDMLYWWANYLNIRFYLTQCNSLNLGDARMTATKPMVMDIVRRADEVIANGNRAADLRFGHDYPLLAVESFFALEGIGERYDAAGAGKHIDINSFSPFAGNLQMIFYKSRRKNKPVLVKFLCNERETPVIGLEPVKGPYYEWDKFKEFIAARFPVDYLGPMKGCASNKKGRHNYQGMDIWGDYMLSCQDGGTASIYKLAEDGKPTKISEFRLGSYDPDLNHSNVVTFFPAFADPSDPLPLVGISRCHKLHKNGLKDELYLERIAPDMKSSSVYRILNYNDVKHEFGYALQWVVDYDNNQLYGYGNTVDNTNPANKHRIVRFRMPDVLAEGPQRIDLQPSDVLENYLVEETYKDPFMPIGQGLFIHEGKLYMPTGVGDLGRPSILYVWDLVNRSMQPVDLTKDTFSELEDCSMHKGKLILQSQGGLWRMNLPE